MLRVNCLNYFLNNQLIVKEWILLLKSWGIYGEEKNNSNHGTCTVDRMDISKQMIRNETTQECWYSFDKNYEKSMRRSMILRNYIVLLFIYFRAYAS